MLRSELDPLLARELLLLGTLPLTKAGLCEQAKGPEHRWRPSSSPWGLMPPTWPQPQSGVGECEREGQLSLFLVFTVSHLVTFWSIQAAPTGCSLHYVGLPHAFGKGDQTKCSELTENQLPWAALPIPGMTPNHPDPEQTARHMASTGHGA